MLGFIVASPAIDVPFLIIFVVKLLMLTGSGQRREDRASGWQKREPTVPSR